MRIKLPYGDTYLEAVIEEKNVAGILLPKGQPILKSPEEVIASALANPIDSPTLFALVKKIKPQKAVIIISDVTRPIPYQEMLPPVLDELHRGGLTKEQICIVIGTGCHRANTLEETEKALGRELLLKYIVENHDCDRNLTSVGWLSDGSELLINSTVAHADLKIALGLIVPHKLAGYSGGAKSILPAVAGRQVIEANHAMMRQPEIGIGRWQDNPIRQQMNEAADMVKLNFILNVVTNEQNKIVAAVAGNFKSAWEAGVDFCRKLSTVEVGYRCPVTIASCGGYPRDINVYQAVKAIINAANITAEGGTLVICARCQEGYGDNVFAEWIASAGKPEDIIKRFSKQFVLGGHKAYVLAKLVSKYEILLVSELSKDTCEKLFFTNQPSLKSALNYVKEKHGPNFRAWVLPYAGQVFPKLAKTEK